MASFVKPRSYVDHIDIGFEAGINAKFATRITYDDVDQGIACHCY
jgi:hypothetical protein